MPIKFGTDGWRAIINKDFNEQNVKLASQAIADYLKDENKKTLVIGFDGRDKAADFAKLTSQVMVANNIGVFLANEPCPTPTIGWAIIAKNADGGIMFTASHNPPQFLGLKYMTDEAMAAPTKVTEKFIKNLAKIKKTNIKITDFNQAQKQNLIKIFDPKTAYFKKISQLIDLEKIKKTPLKILINPMHGVGTGYLSKLLRGGNIKIEEINQTLDSQFGGKTPEPIVEKNVTDAIEIMKKGQFDVCLSSDGDADRIGLIDEKGQMLSSLETFLLLAYYLVVVKGQRGPIISTVSNTVMVEKLCQKYDLSYHETKVGFKYVGEKMKETGAILGGEESGGASIKSYIYVRDAQLMNLFILDLMIAMKKPLSEILKIAKKEAGGGYEFKRVDEHFDYETYEEIKNVKAQKLIENPPQEVLDQKVIKVRTDDGLKLYFQDGSWLLIRFSGTEPVLRLYAEAKNLKKVDALINYAKIFFAQ